MRTRSLDNARSAVASVLVVTTLWGCSPDSTAPEPDPDPVPTSIQATPTTISLDAIGATASASAVVLDQNGVAVPGATIVWSTQDSSVATVTSAGTVTAVDAGSTRVAAASGPLTAEIAVNVSQVPAEVAVTPQSAELIPGDTMTLAAEVKDANGNPIGAAPVTWATDEPSVAIVDAATGFVTAVAEGSVTVAATSGAATGEAAITVLAPPPALEFEVDGTLGGTVNAGAVSIDPGVTVTLTGDVVLNASGPVNISGSVVGECVSLNLATTDSLTLDGASVDTRCGTPPSAENAPELRLFGEGEVTVTGSTILGGGRVFLGNGDEAGPEAGRNPAPAGPDRAGGPPMPCAFVNTTVEGGETATGTGTDVDDLSARLTGSATVSCSGEAFVENVGVRGGDGSDGIADAGLGEAVGTAGGSGGSAVLRSNGPMVLVGSVEMRGGDGGDGGSVLATASAPGGDALARGGSGGWGGLFRVAAPTLTIAASSELVLILGVDGNGGAAVATAGDGEPGMPGGHATALGGPAGWASAGIEFLEGPLLGVSRESWIRAEIGEESIARIRVMDIIAGSGGGATALAGRGGDGAEPGDPGGDGGAGDAAGGSGSRAPLTAMHPGVPPVTQIIGSGGDATWAGGGGGHGRSDICAVGGDGGWGGLAAGYAGPAGDGTPVAGIISVPGTPGFRRFEEFGNGGNGGAGSIAAGGAGSEGLPADGLLDGLDSSVTDGSFRPGLPGAEIPCATLRQMELVWGIESDENGHAPFVNFQAVARAVADFRIDDLLLLIRASTLIPELSGPVSPPPMASAGPEGAVAPGTYGFDLSGTGVVAGFPDVRTTFEGTMEVDGQGNITALEGEMIVDADNDTLPPNGVGERNPVVYRVTAIPTPETAGR